MMTPKRLMELENRAGKKLMEGCVLEHCWLGASRASMEQHAGSWTMPITVGDLLELIELARAAMSGKEQEHDR